MERETTMATLATWATGEAVFMVICPITIMKRIQRMELSYDACSSRGGRSWQLISHRTTGGG